MSTSLNKPPLVTENYRRALLIDWFSGLVAGFVSVTVCAPLDLARTRLMLVGESATKDKMKYGGFWGTLKSVYQNEGVRGLYRGYNVTAFSIPLFHSLYFSIYHQAKRTLKGAEIFKNDLYVNFFSAICTGLSCDLMTNPLWVIRTRLQSQFIHETTNSGTTPYTGLVTGLRTMVREEGFLSLWKGFGASLYGLSHVAVLFPLYEKLKIWRQSLRQGELQSKDIFICSLLAKISAMVLTYPHVVIRARLQDDRTPWKGDVKGENMKKNSFLITGAKMIRTEGIKSLYSGLRVDMVRVLPSNAITFVVFEKMKATLQKKFAEH